MKTESEIQVIQNLNRCIVQMKVLLNQLEPAERLTFVNELMVRLMPSKKKSTAASDKVNAQVNTTSKGLTKSQMQLIRKVSDDTDRLFDFDGNNRA